MAILAVSAASGLWPAESGREPTLHTRHGVNPLGLGDPVLPGGLHRETADVQQELVAIADLEEEIFPK